jgi:hypothetical protein
VEVLLSEGEKLPFELTPELEILRDKRAQAKLWLEKLKRTVSMPKGGARAPSARHNQSGDTSTAEDAATAGGAAAGAVSASGAGMGGEGKLALSEMKQLVEVGEQIYLAEDEIGGGDHGASTVGGRSAVAQSSRELAKAQTVVELAEEVNE